MESGEQRDDPARGDPARGVPPMGGTPGVPADNAAGKEESERDAAERDAPGRDATASIIADLSARRSPAPEGSSGDELRGQDLDDVIAAILSQPGTAGPAASPRVIQPRPPGMDDPNSAPTTPVPHITGRARERAPRRDLRRIGIPVAAGLVVVLLIAVIGRWMYSTTTTSNPESASVRSGTRTRAANTVVAPTDTGEGTSLTTSGAATTGTATPGTATPDWTTVTNTTAAPTTSAATSTTTGTTTGTTGERGDERAAVDQLEAWRAEGLTRIPRGAVGYFVQLSAKQLGLFDEAQNRRYDTWQSIVDDHRRFRDQYGAVLLFSDDVNKNPPGYYLTWFPTLFPTEEAAQSWCDGQGLGDNDCLPRVAP